MASRTDIAVLLFSIAAGLILSSMIVPSVYVTDEVGYSLMAYSLVHDGSLFIWNGLDEAQTWELVLPATDIVKNDVEARLYPLPAPLYTFFAYPFYRFWGLWGLFLLSIVSYSALIVLVYLMARFFFEEKKAALCALAYSLMTNSLSFTSYLIPHLLSTALVCLSALAVFHAVLKKKESIPLAFIGGLAGGLSVGVRFTNGVLILVFAVLLLTHVGRRMLQVFLTGFGIPLVAVAVINYLMFSDVFETSYGPVLKYVKVQYLLLLLPLLFCLWLLKKRKISRFAAFFASAVVFAAFALFFWDKFVFFTSSFYARLFDLRFDPTDVKTVHKKALLQSSSFLILSAFSVLLVKKGLKRAVVYSMAAAAFLTIVFYSTSSHGGQDETLSMRYFMEAVPFLVILSALSIQDMFGRFSPKELVGMSTVLSGIALFFASDGNFIYTTDVLVRSIPSVAALLLLMFCILFLKTRRFRAVCLCLLAVSLGMSLAFAYSDWKTIRWYSMSSNNFEYQIAGLVRDDSAVFVDKRTDVAILMPLKMSKRVRVAVTDMDGSKTAGALVGYYVRKNVTVYYLDVNDNSPDLVRRFQNFSTSYPPGSVNPIVVKANQ